MSNSNGQNAERPTFDFSRYSHKRALLFDAELKRLVRLNEQLDDLALFPTDAEFEAALATRQDKIGKIEAFMCEVLVDVPRAWLVPGAPDPLDWTDLESLGWLRQDMYRELQTAIAQAQQPEQVSGNSAKR